MSLYFLVFQSYSEVWQSVSEIDLEVVNVDKIQQFIDMGRLSPKTNEMITMRDLLAAGVVSQVREGIKLLAKVVFSPHLHK